MWHHNKKNPMAVNKPKAPAKPAAVNATAQANKDSSASLKFSTPEIRVGLSAASQKKPLTIKMPKDKKVIVPKIKVPKVKKSKV